MPWVAVENPERFIWFWGEGKAEQIDRLADFSTMMVTVGVVVVTMTTMMMTTTMMTVVVVVGKYSSLFDILNLFYFVI